MGDAQGPVRAVTWFAVVDGWREFYLMVGTAAVTLAGLLFVAISLHVDALVRETQEHLVALARNTLSSFLFVMVLSLTMLIPHQSMRVTGAMLVVTAAPFFVATIRQMRRPAREHAEFSVALFRRRLIVPLLGYAGAIAVGLLLLSRKPDYLTGLVSVAVLLLANAAGTSWDLLVRVARIRYRSEPERGRG